MAVIAASQEVDDATREALKEVVRALFYMAGERIKMGLNPKNIIEDYLEKDRNS